MQTQSSCASKTTTTTTSNSRTTYKSYRRTSIAKSQTLNNPFWGTNFKAQVKVRRAAHPLPFKICKPATEYFRQIKNLPPSDLLKMKKKSQAKKNLSKQSIPSFNSTNDYDFQVAKQITTQGQEIWRDTCRIENRFLAEKKPQIWRKNKNRSINSHLGDRWERINNNKDKDNLTQNRHQPKYVKVKHTCGNSGFIYKKAQEFENTL